MLELLSERRFPWNISLLILHGNMSDYGKKPLPKFGDWDVNNPASAEGFTVIFNKARNDKKTGVVPNLSAPPKADSISKKGSESSKPRSRSQSLSQYPAKKWFCCTHPATLE